LQERELQLLNASLAEVRSSSEQHQQRVRELEEQIESDDRAERLEESLKNTQNRAEELEFQLSKLKQACCCLLAIVLCSQNK
jgi:chromosome segregation ATPase